MKVVLKSADRMELRGVPQGRGLVFAFLVCIGIAVVAGLFGYIGWARAHSLRGAAVPGAAVVFMLFMLTVLTLLSFRRERLILDKVTRTAEHETWSLLVGTRKSRAYPFERLHGIAIQRTLQSPGGGRGFPIEVTTARLLIVKPRRAIDLDEAQSSEPAPVEALAREVAEFLGLPLKMLGSHD